MRGGEVGAAGDPYSGREDWLSGLGRYRTRDRLEDALRDPSSNRLETYGDERAVLEAVERYVLRGRPELAEVVASARARVDETEALDGQLYRGDGTLTLNGSETGMIDRLEDAVD